MITCFQLSIIAQKKIVVDAEGKGKYKTLQAALDAIPSNSNHATIIYIKKGTYKEKLIVDATKNNITLIGDDKANTILTYDDHAGTRLLNGDTLNTWTCATFVVMEIIFMQNKSHFKIMPVLQQVRQWRCG